MTLECKTFTIAEIHDIYHRYVIKSHDYYNKADIRYKSLPAELKKKYFKIDFPRVASLFDFEDWIKKYDLVSVENLLTTCPNDPELAFLSPKSSTLYEYSNDGTNDLHLFDVEKKDFDFAIFNQTLEHTYNPFLCMANLYSHLKPGGYLYTTVPTINIPHMVPIHFWGITPVGLCVLGASVGFDICECGFWGNYEYIQNIFSTGDWPYNDKVFDRFGKIQHTNLHQAQTWVLLKKPL